MKLSQKSSFYENSTKDNMKTKVIGPSSTIKVATNNGDNS